jgi:hypothetical protein
MVGMENFCAEKSTKREKQEKYQTRIFSRTGVINLK